MAKKCKVIHNHYYCTSCDGSNEGSIVENRQLLSGSGQLSGQGAQSVVFSAPGGSQSLPPDFPLAGLGETASQIVMPEGTIRNLRVISVPHNTGTSGNVDFVVRVNGVDTPVTCQISGNGIADSGAAIVTIADGDLVTIRAENGLQGNVKVNFSYSFEFSF